VADATKAGGLHLNFHGIEIDLSEHTVNMVDRIWGRTLDTVEHIWARTLDWTADHP